MEKKLLEFMMQEKIKTVNWLISIFVKVKFERILNQFIKLFVYTLAVSFSHQR